MRSPFHKDHSSASLGPKPVPRSNLMHEVYSDPFLDWVLILGLSFVAAASLVAVGVSVYLDTGARLETPSAPTSTANRPVIDQGLLESVLSGYDARAAERESIIRSYSAPRDPSLP